MINNAAAVQDTSRGRRGGRVGRRGMEWEDGLLLLSESIRVKVVTRSVVVVDASADEAPAFSVGSTAADVGEAAAANNSSSMPSTS